MTSELRFEVEIDAELLPRVNAASHVESEQSVEERDAGAHAGHRPHDVADLVAVANPAEVSEHGRTQSRIVRPELGARQPERVAALRRVGTLTAHGLRAAKVPAALRRK